MTTYSAFFSSGLLAPRLPTDSFPKTPSKPPRVDGFPTPLGDSSPIRPVSPLPSFGDNDSDVLASPASSSSMDVDTDFNRESTPTQHSVTASLAAGSKATSSSSSTGAQGQPRGLRRRKSSLTMGMSPLTHIRSPSRNASAALQLQRHLALGTRPRGGSVSGAGSASSAMGGEGFASAVFGAASEGTSLMGRLRSGSVGSGHPMRSATMPAPPSMSASGIITSRGLRRHVRRVTTGIPAPAPPPSAPLPALPQGAGFQRPGGVVASAVTRTPFSFQNHDVPGSAGLPGPVKGGAIRGRDRGLSVCSTVERIDEDMKEN